MYSPALDRFERGLYRELADPLPSQYLHHLTSHSPRLASFRTWPKVVAFMHDRAAAAADKNEILLAMLSCRARKFRGAERAALVAIFMPGLRGLIRRRRKWNAGEPEELWQDILTSFLTAVQWLRRSGRRDYLASALMLQTFHLLYEHYQRRWCVRAHEHQLPQDPDDDLDSFEILLGGAEDPAFLGVEVRQAQLACLRALEDLRRKHVINDADFHLMVGTLIYQQPLAEYARLHGLPLEGSKKRRQRAFEKVRRFREKSGREVSPSGPLAGLFLDRP